MKVLPSPRYRSSGARLSLPGVGFSADMAGDGGGTARFLRGGGGGGGSLVLVDATDGAAGVVIVCGASEFGDGRTGARISVTVKLIITRAQLLLRRTRYVA